MSAQFFSILSFMTFLGGFLTAAGLPLPKGVRERVLQPILTRHFWVLGIPVLMIVEVLLVAKYPGLQSLRTGKSLLPELLSGLAAGFMLESWEVLSNYRED